MRAQERDSSVVSTGRDEIIKMKRREGKRDRKQDVVEKRAIRGILHN